MQDSFCIFRIIALRAMDSVLAKEELMALFDDPGVSWLEQVQ